MSGDTIFNYANGNNDILNTLTALRDDIASLKTDVASLKTYQVTINILLGYLSKTKSHDDIINHDDTPKNDLKNKAFMNALLITK